MNAFNRPPNVWGLSGKPLSALGFVSIIFIYSLVPVHGARVESGLELGCTCKLHMDIFSERHISGQRAKLYLSLRRLWSKLQHRSHASERGIHCYYVLKCAKMSKHSKLVFIVFTYNKMTYSVITEKLLNMKILSK